MSVEKTIEVKTFEDARKLSLIKWTRVRESLIHTGLIMDEDCVFCEYAETLVEWKGTKADKKLEACRYCPVELLCQELIDIKLKNYTNLLYFIYDLVDKLEEMREENYKSRHQLKGGE